VWGVSGEVGVECGSVGVGVWGVWVWRWVELGVVRMWGWWAMRKERTKYTLSSIMLKFLSFVLTQVAQSHKGSKPTNPHSTRNIVTNQSLEEEEENKERIV
jgi:hypothetical protein